LPYLDLVPVLAGEGILSLLLETLLALREALVPIPLSDIDLRMYLLPLHRVPSPGFPSSPHISRRVKVTHFPTAMIAICYAVEMACCGEQVVELVVGF
jgi:hypothetical protein